MPMVAKQAPYTLFVVDDNDAQSPREDRDNFGTMVCFHKRYSLGDEHKYSEPNDFLIGHCLETVPADEILNIVKNGEIPSLRIVPDNENEGCYNLEYYSEHYKEWQTETDINPDKKVDIEYAAEKIAENLTLSKLSELIREHNVMLPLYLYDHSGITMNTGGFSCPWDSGQVGWIYAAHEDIKKEYGDVTPETLTRAESLLQSEVEEYDLYITGQCYGFKLYEGHNEIDSCWGFLSSFSDIGKQIKEHLPENCRDIVDLLEYQPDRIDEDEYLENENEEDLER